MINITIEDRNGEQQPIEIPEEISLSLMEVLKASDYNILATCGGMALCATCHVQVLKGLDDLPQAGNEEMNMLDTLPDAGFDSRLACQIRITENLNGMIFRIRGDEL
ncbi:MAG: ferredoxin [Sphingobacteriales bacterium 17-39-43]|uniref:2Fe-2S iron-sulfur cluster-binding protein n=1 Tax=Daejeonella sp. TaxID=2805397 RepID=UPI000BD2FC9A|nr:2Fe-2S iron-sulfur cluster-binding protein [Daejeonella sp.]OYZ33203.1 MAG: ferredoxin [Sphingobacteriales bacterium 16-39-50]OZA26612.1 MAG: ferredoxin [Sphingobacteriales bacterium 17-39-43]HQS51310.1 2Fe-2S iron-sulfur cluster-binding protein [Daejeonella sp.]HQT21771.1 2Fe-2S iron-sulfur cluster-binding protein [Daejeonella sp.]HQT56502.1 2Fe-2S iron-sulfur cluster-binding protein [Daejeonella sp.]